jgi:uncharacterized membrane protein
MIRLWRVVTLIGYFGLFGLLLLWLAWLEPPVRLPIALALILWAGPLLFSTHGLLNGRRYTHAWTSFLALFYFAFGVFHAAGPMARPWLAWLAIGFSVLLFLGTIFYVRASGRARARADGSGATAPVAGPANGG